MSISYSKQTFLIHPVSFKCLNYSKMMPLFIFIFQPFTAGFRRPKATTESSEDKMWEELHLNNTETHNEDAILQSDVAFTIDSEKDTLGFPDEKDFQHTEQSNG